mmetsp:Transcript_15009/g.30391  ORF Transcript_15009/g.30391 Transcript_15009/m.30391 type:complete len:232 (-) Transcript_15009:195-890(-)
MRQRGQQQKSKTTAGSKLPSGDAVASSTPNQEQDVSPVLRLVGSSTKWVVGGSVGMALLLVRNAAVLNMILGALANALFNKALKRVINEARPDGAVLKDPGMPSSHACSLAFLSTFGVLALLFSKPVWWPAHLSPYPLISAILAYDFVSLRYRLKSGLHTLPQLVVGATVGGLNASWFFFLCELSFNENMVRLLGSDSVPLSVAVAVNVFGAVVLSRGIRKKIKEMLKKEP